MRIFTLDWASAPNHDRDGKCSDTGILMHGICTDGTKVSKVIQGFQFRFWVMLRAESDIRELSGILRRVHNIEISKDNKFTSIEIERFRGREQLFARLSSNCAECLRQAYFAIRSNRWDAETPMVTFEGTMSPTTRLLQVLEMGPHTWVEVPMTEVIMYTDIFKTGCDTLPEALCVAAFDIECLSDDCVSFPDADNELDTIEQIGLVLTYPFSSRPAENYMYTVQDLVSSSMTIIKCASERQMWEKFRVNVKAHVHVLASYNGFAFDYPYMIKRCKIDEPVFKKNFTTAAFGCQSYTFVEFDGVVQLDMMVYLRKEKKLESYKLDSVAEHFLGMHKHDVTPQQIFTSLKSGTTEDRRTIAEYCIQDCALVVRLMDKLQVLHSLFAMCRVTACPLNKLNITGQQARTLDLLSQKLYSLNLLLPDRPKDATGPDEDSYTGATVLEAKAGLYMDPVAGLDFASLYPSIMIANNLCVSTRHVGVPDDVTDFHNIDGTYYRKEPLGVIPQVLEYLWSTRKATRTTMKHTTDPDMLSTLNAQQLSYKLVMNSLYGTLGSSYFPINSQSIAKGVTWFGRKLLNMTQEMIMSKYGDRCEIVYGDSVTADTPVTTKEGPVAIADLAGRWCRYRHPDPMQQRLGRARGKQVAAPLRKVHVATSSGWQQLQYLVRRKHTGKMYVIRLSDGTCLTVTGDHAIWSGGGWVAAKDLRVGVEL